MEKYIFSISLLCSINVYTQITYESITISRCRIEIGWYRANWPDSLKMGIYTESIYDDPKKTFVKNVWTKEKQMKELNVIF